jgi:hypothetical protein
MCVQDQTTDILFLEEADAYLGKRSLEHPARNDLVSGKRFKFLVYLKATADHANKSNTPPPGVLPRHYGSHH